MERKDNDPPRGWDDLMPDFYADAGFPGTSFCFSNEHVFERFCKGNDCRIQSALFSTMAVLALWVSHAGVAVWRRIENKFLGSAGVALGASVLLTVGWGFLVANHQDFLCMAGFFLSAWSGAGVMKSVLQIHRSFPQHTRSWVRLMLMASTEASPIVFTVMGMAYHKHVVTLKTLFTGLGVLSFLTGCIIYVLVIGEGGSASPSPSWQQRHSGVINPTQVPYNAEANISPLAAAARAHHQQQQLTLHRHQRNPGGGASGNNNSSSSSSALRPRHSAYPPPLATSSSNERLAAMGYHVRAMIGRENSAGDMKHTEQIDPDGLMVREEMMTECCVFSAVLPYTLREPERQVSLCVSTSPDRGVLMPTGVWESVGGISQARSSPLFMALTAWLAITLAVVWHYVVTVAAHGVVSSNQPVWVWKHDHLPIAFAWLLPLAGCLLPVLSKKMLDTVAPSTLYFGATVCALAYAFFASLEGVVASIATLVLALALRAAPILIAPIVLEQVFGSFRLCSLQESLHVIAATFATPLVLLAVWVPALRSSFSSIESTTPHSRPPAAAPSPSEPPFFGWRWGLDTCQAETAAAAAGFGLASGMLGLLVAQMLRREENPKLKDALEQLFRLVRVDLDGLVEWGEFWQVARMFSIEDDRQINSAWERALLTQYKLDSGGIIGADSPRSLRGMDNPATNSLLPVAGGSGSSNSNGDNSFTAYVNTKVVPQAAAMAAVTGQASVGVSGGWPVQRVGSEGPLVPPVRSPNKQRLGERGLEESKSLYYSDAAQMKACNVAHLGISVLGRGMSSAIETEGEGELERIRVEVVVRQMWQELSKGHRCSSCSLFTVAEKHFEHILVNSALIKLRRRQLHGESHFFDEMGKADPIYPSNSGSGSGVLPRVYSNSSHSSLVPRSATQWGDSEEDSDDSLTEDARILLPFIMQDSMGRPKEQAGQVNPGAILPRTGGPQGQQGNNIETKKASDAKHRKR
eukprot:CAMPEP_0114524814 /NCGR_PEP_ID=MMETSP0109-20121206/22067_1 /TAXON_ID=29199 /ORGANISM="Chlorarachnion reptans, Strain CCCM449" /LENGTH=975 /DNA_ID=CAMNT_0001706305 /DNA_START=286 /DNA_END=3217 /DNA_ORIENTATION=-